ncbi:uncharacterized protein LOC144620034 [Crassostrea virginica]
MNKGKERKKMDKCSSGYYGDFCNRTCPSGSYGPRCGGMCTPKCSAKTCHHVYGCPEIHKTTVQEMTSAIGKNSLTNEIATQNYAFSPEKESAFVTDIPLTKRGTKSHRLQITTRDFLETLQGNIPFKPESKNEFQATYMLLGIGALISLFLFIIVIQLCRRSSSSKTRNISQQSNDDTTLNSDSLNQANLRGYNVISEQFKEHSYRPFDVQYTEINENLEMHIPNALAAQNGDEISVVLYENPKMREKFEDRKDNNFLEDTCMQEEAMMGVDTAKDYLNPIFIPRVSKSSWKENDRLFINVEQVS